MAASSIHGRSMAYLFILVIACLGKRLVVTVGLCPEGAHARMAAQAAVKQKCQQEVAQTWRSDLCAQICTGLHLLCSPYRVDAT